MVRKYSAFIAVDIIVRFSDYNYNYNYNLYFYDEYWYTLFDFCRNMNHILSIRRLIIILFYFPTSLRNHSMEYHKKRKAYYLPQP